MKLSYIKVPFFNLFLAGAIGVFLRYFYVRPLWGVNFKYLVHTHSHVAFLGWVYLILFLAVLFTFFPAKVRNKKTYVVQFWLTQLSVVGMLFSFPFQGYGLYSIIFSTMHIFLSWWFIFSVKKDLKKVYTPVERKSPAVRFLNAGFLFLFISAAGPFALGPLMVKGFGGTDYYYMAIYYYLHFQYNGWFLFGLMAVIFKYIESISALGTAANKFFSLMFVSAFFTLSLSALFAKPDFSVVLTGLIGAIIQLAGFAYLVRILRLVKKQLHIPGILRGLALILIICFVVKLVFQAASVFVDVLHIRTFVIAYLHLVLLGIITAGLFLFMFLNSWLSFSIINRAGILLFLSGFVVSEVLLFGQGFMAWFKLPFGDLSSAVFYTSLLILAGIGVLTLSLFVFEKPERL